MRAPEDLKKKLAEQEAGNPLNLPPMPEGFSACELVKRDFPEPLWIIPELLTEGLGILAGRPKTGKSWLALGLSIAGATGGRALGKIKVDKSPVLYLALEDTPRRLKSRLQQVLCGNMAPESLYFQTEWPRIDQGALPLLEKWLEAHPETRFVIIDTLAKLWPKGNGKDSGSAYHQDYNTLSAIKTIADLHQISILLVTHLRKSPVPTFCISLYLTGPIPSSNVKI
jgi:RecA-family ATPase